MKRSAKFLLLGLLTLISAISHGATGTEKVPHTFETKERWSLDLKGDKELDSIIVFMDYGELNYIEIRPRRNYLKGLAKLFNNPKFGIFTSYKILIQASKNETQWNELENQVKAICADTNRVNDCMDIADVRLKVLDNVQPHFGDVD